MKNIISGHIVLFILGSIFIQEGLSQSSADSLRKSSGHSFLNYGGKGFEFRDESGNNLMQLEFRGQFRLTYPTNSDPIAYDDYTTESVYIGIQRARLKVGGHSLKPWLKYYLEYELFSSNLLDFRLMYEKDSRFKIKVGQWKVQYNRERIISSGKQQTMERSILTRAFTIDRQQGVSVYGNMAGKGAANFNYWLSVFVGTGRGSKLKDDNNLMYMGRLQWNPSGKPLKFAGSDIEFHERLTALIAIAGVTNQSPYTRFSQSGGGQLEGFEDGISGQYRVNQFMQESAGKYRGFSWQQEFHFKQINDQTNNSITEMYGNLVQAGIMLNALFKNKDKQSELYVRQAFYFPNSASKSEQREEYTAGFNWFLSGHRNKITTEVSYLESSFASNINASGWRCRLQWDVSF